MNNGFACAVLCCLAASLAAQDDDPRATVLDRRMMTELRGRYDSPHARLHYDPDAVSDTQRDAAVADIEAGFAKLERALDMRFRGRILVFLYADAEDMGRRTGAEDGVVAFSTGTVSLHEPHDFRGVHELTHLFAMQLPRTEDSVSDPFVVEGLATWLAEQDEGVPIHSWAAVCLAAGRLPDLVELRRTFPDGAGQCVHPYHVAGSFVGYLIERFGMAAVKGYYVNSTEAQHWFGTPVRALEREWRQWLTSVDVAAEHRAVVLAKLGLAGRPVPAAIAAAEAVDLLAARSLDAFSAESPREWSFVDGVLRGEHAGPWTHLPSAQRFGARVAVRARLRLVSGDAVKLQLNRGERVNEAVLATWATFVGSGGAYAGTDKVRVAPGVWHDLVFVHDGDTNSLYVDGALVLEAGDAPSRAAGPVGIGVEKGVVEVARFEVVELR